MFRSQTDPVAQELLDRIGQLSKQVAELRGERDAIEAARQLTEERTHLRDEIETLTIEKGRREEDFAREKREVEHATGLHRRQTEWERKKAVEEAKLEVQKGNLDAERVRFAEQIKFHKEQIKNEVDRLEKLLTALMERLPTVTVEKSIDFSLSATGNGKG